MDVIIGATIVFVLLLAGAGLYHVLMERRRRRIMLNGLIKRDVQ